WNCLPARSAASSPPARSSCSSGRRVSNKASPIFDLGVLFGALLFFVTLHPAPGILWFDFSWITYNLSPLPLNLAGANEAIRWQASAHSSFLVRPARAIQWWLAVKAIGCRAFGYW